MSKSSVASFALGLVGGYFFGPIGFAIGGSIGAALVPPELPDQTGPRLDDLTIAGSGYGAGIPKLFGTTRVATNMIWTSGKIETEHTQEVGGKGTPSQTVTTYTYAMSAAYLIGEGPISGVRRIWINSKLVWDHSDTASGDMLAAGAGIADAITIYPGDETQTASSLQESYEGAGTVPAYRGTAYIEFDNLQLADFGNGFVNVEVEVVDATASETQPTRIVNTCPDDPNEPYDIKPKHSGVLRDGVGFRSVADWNSPTTPAWCYLKYQYFSLADGSILHEYVRRVDKVGVNLQYYLPVRNMPHIGLIHSQTTPVQSKFVVWGNESSGTIVHPFAVTNDSPWGYGANDWAHPCEVNGYIIAVHTLGISRWNYNKVTSFPSLGSSLSATWGSLFPAGSGTTHFMVPDEDGEHFWIFNQQAAGAYSHYLVYMDTDFNVLCYWSKNNLGFTFTDAFVARWGWEVGTEDKKYIMFKPDTGVYVYSLDVTTPASSPTLISSTTPGGGPVGLTPLGGGLGMDRDTWGLWYIEPLLPQASAGLDDVVSDLCLAAGLTAGDIDVTALAADTVNGYAIARPSSARAGIEPLQRAYFFDGALVDGKVQFIKRGGASVKTIADADLAAHDFGQSPPDITTITRSGELELPRRVSVSYQSQAAGYMVNEQHADRLSFTGDSIVSNQLPIAMTDDAAAQVAEITLYAAHAERESVTVQLATKHLEVAPGDIITVGTDAHRVRVIDVDVRPMGVINVTGVIEYADAYTSTATGAAAIVTSASVGNIGPTSLQLIDTSILREDDDGAGFYAAARGFLTGWNGAIAYKSLDAGISYAEAASILAKSTMGWTTDILADGGTTTWDRDNTVTIVLSDSQSLASDSELNVMNGANVAVLGVEGRWEIIQWATATDNGDGTFTLSNLLRGRKGTEHNTGNHVKGDNFIVLSTTTTERILITSAEVDAEVLWKGVSIGNLIQNADAYPYTNTAEALIPYYPVWIRGSRDGSNNLTVTWARRSRYDYRSNYTIPLGEDTQSYELEFWDSTDTTQYGGTKTSTTPTYSYTAAAQTSDSATPGQSFTVRIYQISAAVGRGRKGSALI